MFQPVHMLPGRGAPFLISCEHAANALPPERSWPEEDQWIIDSHWAWDPGAADIVALLAEATGAAAVMAGFSRLYVDPNRPMDSPTLIRERADDRQIFLNQGLSESDRQARIDRCYTPYHEALFREAQRDGDLLLSIHSFTPDYEGCQRPMEVAVMHVDQEEAAIRWCGIFTAAGFPTVINEPYSGKDGFMHSVYQAAEASGRRAMMLEFRQDIITPKADAIVQAIQACLEDRCVKGEL